MPFVVSDTARGGYLVVWRSLQAGVADIYGRYLDVAGRPLGAAFAISTARGDQLRPTAAYVPAAEAFLVVWQDSRASNDPDIYGRLVPTYGTSALGGGNRPLGAEWAVCASQGGQYIPTVACENARPVGNDTLAADRRPGHLVLAGPADDRVARVAGCQRPPAHLGPDL